MFLGLDLATSSLKALPAPHVTLSGEDSAAMGQSSDLYKDAGLSRLLAGVNRANKGSYPGIVAETCQTGVGQLQSSHASIRYRATRERTALPASSRPPPLPFPAG